MSEIDTRTLWTLIHVTALSGDSRSVAYVVYSVMQLIGDDCGDHVKKFATENNIMQCGDIMSLFEWTWRLHDDVNQRLGRQSISLLEAFEMYQSLKSIVPACR